MESLNSNFSSVGNSRLRKGMICISCKKLSQESVTARAQLPVGMWAGE